MRSMKIRGEWVIINDNGITWIRRCEHVLRALITAGHIPPGSAVLRVVSEVEDSFDIEGFVAMIDTVEHTLAVN